MNSSGYEIVHKQKTPLIEEAASEAIRIITFYGRLFELALPVVF